MTKQPKISPTLLALFMEAAPKRLVRKLDKEPNLAKKWLWTNEPAENDCKVEELHVETDKGEVVTMPLLEAITKVEDVKCTCLLAPRCLHILAVASLLDIADDVDGDGKSTLDDDDTTAAAIDYSKETKTEAPSFSDKEIEAARRAFTAGAHILSAGIPGCGGLLQANLLRAIHACRTNGLHRLAAASVRVLQSIREYREESPLFQLSDYGNSLHELLEVSYKIQREKVGSDDEGFQLRGTARRKYGAIGSLKLTGLLCEPILTASGYAGVCTYLLDDKGNIYSLSDVIPGDGARVRPAYGASVSLGDLSLPHKLLCRQGLLIQDATASSDGRLGHGAKTKAARRQETSWFDEEVSHLWTVPIADQLKGICLHGQKPLLQRPAGWDFIFLEGVVLGAHQSALLLNVNGITLRCEPSIDDDTLSYRENFQQLGRQIGLPIRAVGRLSLNHHRTVELLAIGEPVMTEDSHSTSKNSPRLSLPEKWVGRVNLGFERLQGLHFKGGGEGEGSVTKVIPRQNMASQSQPFPLHVLTRRLRRLALGGVATLPPEASAEIAREGARLRKQMMATGAHLLGQLLASAHERERTIAGVKQGDPLNLAKAWLAASTYVKAATLDMNSSLWLNDY